jgi:Raf kinase inhibitor-like YbhB/YbcL family protein
MRTILLVALLLMTIAACGRAKPNLSDPVPSPSANASAQQKSGLKLTSTSFKEGEAIPRGYTCDGANVSPSLEWTGVPKTAKTIAIIADDPDAPSGTFVHWILFNLPADGLGLIENTPQTETLNGGGVQGKNDFGKVGYGGPCPPSGTHRYFFKFYALDGELPLKPGATRDEVEKAMEGHIVAQAQLMGTYSRK